MAAVLPAKRPNGFADPHRASINGVAGPSRTKRRRISAQPSERSYSEDVESRRAEDEDPPSPVSDDEMEDEHELFRATQIVEKSFRKHASEENTPAEAGIIEEIRCTNFMCHDQLTVTLGPLINFIIGENGSGKSAVLTALTLCLGGKATATNRGQNLKAFIKAGREFCILSVKIKNQGSMAYKPEQYGDSIIAERHFNQSGTSGFKLKDRNGKIVSTRKSELEDITDAFALQLDNPMNVLTQDQARQFLNQSNPKEKYKFFLKGTQLEDLNSDYKQIEHELEEQEEKAQTLHGDLEKFRKRYEKAFQKAKGAETLEKMRRRETEIAHQAAWAQVEKEERELQSTDVELERISNVIEQRKAEEDTESESYSHADKALSVAKRELEECQAEVQPARDEVAECNRKFQDNKKIVMKYKADERQLLGQIETSQNAIDQTQSDIQEHRERQAGADNGLHAQKVQEWEDAKATYEERKAAWENHDHSLPALTKQMAEAQNQKSQVDGRLQQKRNEETGSRMKLRNLAQGQRKWIDSYPNPPTLEKLIRAIVNETRFREPPVGPMGRYVELLKPEWGSILEKSFGQSLNAFVVTSKDDHTILSDMMKRHNYQVPIFIGKKDLINTSANEPNKDLLTWMRVLKISNELVRNQLIINQSIEQVVLIQRRSDASDFMNSGGPHRTNVRMCFCMSDSSRRMGHAITVNQQTNTSSIGPIEEFRGPSRMQADQGEQIQDEQDNLASIQQEIADLEAAARAAQDQLNVYQARIQNHKKQRIQFKMQMDRAHDDMGRLEDEVNASTPDAGIIEELEKQLVVAKERKEMDEKQFEDFIAQKDKADKDARLLKKQLDETTNTLGKIEAQYERLSAKVLTLTQRREDKLRRKNEAIDEVQAAEGIRADWENHRIEQETELARIEAEATSICARVPVPAGETFDSLNRKRQTLEQQRKEGEKALGGSVDELYSLANDAKKTFHEARMAINGTENVRRVLKQALGTRQERWKKLRDAISMRARIVFNYLLSERRFRGSLSVDHKNQRLDIHIQPDITVKEDAGRQTKTLSGGEKSFSTICLLLALWDAMGSPIRCLDEFDVYMDQANRDITMKLIVGAARKSVGRQYILITPQAISNANVGNADDVKIIRLAAPERGQTTLAFSG